MKLFPSHYLISDCRNEYAHQRADEVEETIRKVCESRHAEHRALRHAARVPRNKYRGNRHGIFGGATQQPAFVTLILINIAKHIPGQNDRDILIGRGYIEENIGACERILSKIEQLQNKDGD